jgi:hypothetical protein
VLGDALAAGRGTPGEVPRRDADPARHLAGLAPHDVLTDGTKDPEGNLCGLKSVKAAPV